MKTRNWTKSFSRWSAITPRRQGVTRTVGIIVPEEDARCFAAYKAGCQQGGKWQGIAMTIIATIAVIGMTVAALL